MSPYHVAGCCANCGAQCFEVMAVFDQHERLPGEPKRLGPPNADAVRVTYLLIDGSKAMLTFCGDCAGQPIEPHFSEIWWRVVRSWTRELAEKQADDRNPSWFPQQFSNGLLCELGRSPWTEVWKNG